jgi:Family of unknown function (DUF5758)/Pentapeptide repeats (8 copies)
MKFEIKDRFTGKVIYQDEAESFAALVSAAVKAKANLQSADLRSANLQFANLQFANLQFANLQFANLQFANLQSADLQSADLRSADLQSAKNSEVAQAQTLIVPQEGTFVGWKKCKNSVIVRLLIPMKSRRSNATGRKCRAEFVRVLEVFGSDKGVSIHDGRTEYIKGATVRCDKWNEDRFEECSGGIHFYLTRLEAENHQ